jgi:hypothetical protein
MLKSDMPVGVDPFWRAPFAGAFGGTGDVADVYEVPVVLNPNGVIGEVGEDSDPALLDGDRKALLLIRLTAVTALMAAYV